MKVSRLYSGFLVFLFISFEPAWGVQIGEKAPACKKPFLESKQLFDIGAYRGKALLIDFWATWCPPCKRAIPFLNDLRNEFADSGFEIIAVNVDEETQDLDAFLKTYPINYKVLVDAQGDCPKAYGVLGMPSSYFVDKSGKVDFIHIGFRDSDKAEIRARIKKLLE